MKNFKRAAAILGVVLILAVFCLPMMFASGSGENSQGLFRASLGAAFMVPVLIYIFWMVYRIFGKKKTKEERAVENIIFDVGQVLVTYDWQTYLKGFGFSEDKYERLADTLFRSESWNERDRGVLTEEECVQGYVDALPEYEADIREIMRRTPETITVRDYSQTWLKYLKNQGYHIYILSNFSQYMLDIMRPQMTFLKYVDGEIFSCEVKDIKPNAGIYKALLTRFGLKPEKSVFLDDRGENCEAAQKQGIRAIVFKDFKQAAAELEKLGVK